MNRKTAAQGRWDAGTEPARPRDLDDIVHLKRLQEANGHE
jgi:hypothetical protein